MDRQPAIEEEYDVFIHDGDVKIGAVRQVSAHELIIYVENAGDFVVPRSAVIEVNSGKVVLRCNKLDTKLRRAIGHAHDAEDPNVARRP
jgi:hypothetical protein